MTTAEKETVRSAYDHLVRSKIEAIRDPDISHVAAYLVGLKNRDLAARMLRVERQHPGTFKATVE